MRTPTRLTTVLAAALLLAACTNGADDMTVQEQPDTATNDVAEDEPDDELDQVTVEPGEDFAGPALVTTTVGGDHDVVFELLESPGTTVWPPAGDDGGLSPAAALSYEDGREVMVGTVAAVFDDTGGTIEQDDPPADLRSFVESSVSFVVENLEDLDHDGFETAFTFDATPAESTPWDGQAMAPAMLTVYAEGERIMPVWSPDGEPLRYWLGYDGQTWFIVTGHGGDLDVAQHLFESMSRA